MELQVQELKVRCRAFFVRAIREIQARFVLDDKIYEISELLQPKNAHSNVPSSLAELFVRFPSLKECCDIQNADEEWRALRNLSPSVFGLNTIDEVKQLSVESYWSIIFSLKTVTNTPRFLNLKPCISLIFSLPTSNAAAERVFSSVKLIKTDHRNRLTSETLASLIQTKRWLTNENKTSATVIFPKPLMAIATKVQANKAIHPGAKSKSTDKDKE